MDSRLYDEASNLMDVMGFDEEEREIVMSNEEFAKLLVDDPNFYNKKYFRYIADMSHEL